MTNINQPITMDDSNQKYMPEPGYQPANMFLNTFLEAFNKHIDMLVETKFNAMVENRRALHLMDQALETMIDQKIDRAVEQAVAEHEQNEDHLDSADIMNIAADQARVTLTEYAKRQEGWVTQDQVNDLITAHVDEELDLIDWEEKVKDVLREML